MHLVLKKNVKVKDLEKYGFKVLITEEELNEDNYYCNMAYKNEGNHFSYVIENDEYYRQLTIVPERCLNLPVCLGWHLGLLYRMIIDGIFEEVVDPDSAEYNNDIKEGE